MAGTQDIRVVAMGLGNGCRDDLVQAILEQNWSIDVAGDVEELLARASSEAYHLAVLACQDPAVLPKQAVRNLLGMQSDMSVVFLVPPDRRGTNSPPLIGATSDQVFRLDSPTEKLIEAFSYELESVLTNQPEYTIVCVDDDEGFLMSLESLLSGHLRKTLPRFALHVESFANPKEALAKLSSVVRGYPAVIISDQIMPEMAGTEMLKRAKRLYPDARCVLLTGHAALDSAVVAVNEKLLDKYCFKPVEDPVDFANNIRHLLLEHHLRAKEHKQRDRLVSQFEFMRTISVISSVDAALNAAVEFLRDHFLPQHVVIAVKDEDGCTIRAGYGLPDDLPIGSQVGEQGVFEQVLTRGRAVLTSDAQVLPPALRTDQTSRPIMALPLARGEQPIGVILMVGRHGGAPFTREGRMLATFIADVTAVTVSGLEDRRALEDVYLGTMATLMETVEAKDVYTRGHTDRVTDLAVDLARALGIKGRQLEDIRRAAALHDIGKIAVPDEIILKPGPLDPQERSAMQEHCARAERILQHLRFLDSVRIIIRGHHERYDGSGYPDGLKGEEIPLGARILAIVDSYDAMTSARPYRQAMSAQDALKEIEANAGKQFDPKLVMVFMELMHKTRQVASGLSHRAVAGRE